MQVQQPARHAHHHLVPLWLIRDRPLVPASSPAPSRARASSPAPSRARASSPNRPPGCKSRLIGSHMVGCIVASTMRKASSAQARWILSNRPFPRGQAPAVQKVGTARAEDHLKSARDSKISGSVSRASSVTSPIFGHLPTQHPPYQYRHRRRRRLHRSIPSPTEGGAAEVYSISVRGRRGGGLLHLWPREARRRSTSTLGLSSKSTAAVSNATGTSPCPPAPSVPIIAG
jgi:hypothetical protein